MKNASRAALVVTALVAAAVAFPSPDAPAAPADPCAARAVASVSTRWVDVGGARRSYTLATPARAEGGRRAPVLLAFHGYSSSPARLDAAAALVDLATRAGWAVVLPAGSGSPPRWTLAGRLEGGDDLRFVRAVLDDVTRSACADTASVAAVGFSNGAGFVGELACAMPRRIRAIALVAGAGLARTCPSTPAVPALLVQSTTDHIVRYDGGSPLGGTIAIEPFDAAHARWERATGGRADALVVTGPTHAWPPGATEAILSRF